VSLRGPAAPLITLVMVLVACTGTVAPAATPDPTPSATADVATTRGPTPSTTLGSTPTPSGTAAQGGQPSDDCIAGWTSPSPGSPEYEDGMQILAGFMGQEGSWQVEEMRHFTGPDAPWIIEPRYEVVHRWYIRAGLADDPEYRGRWLVELRTDRINGVAAVAPYESEGYRAPDWRGFVGDGPPTTYPGLPGRWSGIEYDFVTGDGDHGMPGLPDEVVGCLDGT